MQVSSPATTNSTTIMILHSMTTSHLFPYATHSSTRTGDYCIGSIFSNINVSDQINACITSGDVVPFAQI